MRSFFLCLELATDVIGLGCSTLSKDEYSRVSCAFSNEFEGGKKLENALQEGKLMAISRKVRVCFILKGVLCISLVVFRFLRINFCVYCGAVLESLMQRWQGRGTLWE